jgi:hypothetical protein
MHLMKFARAPIESEMNSHSLGSSQSHTRFTDVLSNQRHLEILMLLKALSKNVDRLHQKQDDMIVRLDALTSAPESTRPVDVDVPSPVVCGRACRQRGRLPARPQPTEQEARAQPVAPGGDRGRGDGV